MNKKSGKKTNNSCILRGIYQNFAQDELIDPRFLSHDLTGETEHYKIGRKNLKICHFEKNRPVGKIFSI